MTTFLMIRHGESEANRGRVFAGHMDAALQDRGLEQAKRTAEYIVRTYCVDAVYASDLRRAYDTGKCVAELLGLPVIADRDLREIDAGEWEGVKFDELVKRFPEDYGVWLHDIGHARCTGGESVAALAHGGGERRENGGRCDARDADPRDAVFGTGEGTGTDEGHSVGLQCVGIGFDIRSENGRMGIFLGERGRASGGHADDVCEKCIKIWEAEVIGNDMQGTV